MGKHFIPIAIGNLKKVVIIMIKCGTLRRRRGVASINIVATDFNPLKRKGEKH